MPTAPFSEILVPIDQNTRCHLSRDRKRKTPQRDSQYHVKVTGVVLFLFSKMRPYLK